MSNGSPYAPTAPWTPPNIPGCYQAPPVLTRIDPYNHVYSGRRVVATAGVPVQFFDTKVPCAMIEISGDTDIGVVCVVGDQTIQGTAAIGKSGVVIIPGNDPVKVYISDLSYLWVDAEVNGGTVCFSYYSY